MNPMDRLETYKKIAEARYELSKKRSDLTEKKVIHNYANCADEETVGANREKLNNMSYLLQQILEKKRELQCLLSDAKSSVSCDISPPLQKKILEMLIEVTSKLEPLEKNTADKDLPNTILALVSK
ncbi:hypothetical protein CHUAL_011770 [Chamberlinius hualienensis]